MSQIVKIVIAIVAVLIISVVCYITRKPIKKYAGKVWSWVVNNQRRASSYVRSKVKREKALIKYACGQSHLS
ncbi:MAG: hypothetical protein ACXABY_20305 [Candidatus Thorarchaeota archaeon]|jgi:hypothetical protein